MDDFIDFCQHRRSVRNFKPKMVARQDIIDLLIAASFAPSISDLQPWEFVVVEKPEVRDSVAGCVDAHEWLYDAPVIIVVLADMERAEAYHGQNARLACRDSCSAAIMNILHAALARDLGACWIGQFDFELLAESLNIPDSHEPIALIPVGYPEEIETVPKHVNALDECTFFNQYGNRVTDEATRLRDFGEAGRESLSDYSDTIKKKQEKAVERAKPMAEKFKDQLRDWMNRSEKKK